MKTLIASALVATAALAGGASAMTSTSAAEVKIQRYAPDADLSALSDAQIASLLNVVNGGDSRGETESKIESLLRAYN
ncbi:hypothetical protein [Roseivivax isoporae]|uniref:Uncharacterized protein n=1 Tax=Roseivivax isoporae LMG 25204 TaxID=1449351 RepID=X7F848_9RHOB|nr:hypothetical protein [Roseivivax isoporae]ETX28275.1 hypothetical protein RISW2_08760 [Roseivivax isoporae LMG 25204]ETX28276.1 hypothetical protein RISW2_08765 [Roseivivax isoporae LMG 25204]ETX28277.1 hypothetical protein RISW2_08770 [Roseivivax isoporae LMG 25204]